MHLTVFHKSVPNRQILQKKKKKTNLIMELMYCDLYTNIYNKKKFFLLFLSKINIVCSMLPLNLL